MYPGGGTDPTANHYAADRATLRRLLSSGLDDVLHTGAEFVDYEVMPDGRVRADFADGRTASGDLLVGADGANSRVRRHLLPELATSTPAPSASRTRFGSPRACGRRCRLGCSRA